MGFFCQKKQKPHSFYSILEIPLDPSCGQEHRLSKTKKLRSNKRIKKQTGVWNEKKSGVLFFARRESVNQDWKKDHSKVFSSPLTKGRNLEEVSPNFYLNNRIDYWRSEKVPDHKNWTLRRAHLIESEILLNIPLTLSLCKAQSINILMAKSGTSEEKLG